MKNKFKAIFMSILLAFSVIIPSLASIKPASATDTIPDAVNITLHKRVFKDGQKPSDIQNTGELMENFGGTALPNVGFTVYDITEEYINDLKAENATADGVTSALVTKYTNETPTATVAAAQALTDKDGNVTFSNLATKDSNDNFKTYLILETKTPSAITEKSAPIVLTMPIYSQKEGADATTALTDIHVYPKNSENTDNYDGKLTKRLVTEIPHQLAWDKLGVNNNIVLSPRLGRLLEYEVTYDVPSTTIFDDVNGIEIVDDPALGIVVPDKVAIDASGNVVDTIVDAQNAPKDDAINERSNVQVFVGDKQITDVVVDYEGVDGGNSVVKLQIKKAQHADLAGEKLTIKYYAYLGKKNNEMDNPIDNKVKATANTTSGITTGFIQAEKPLAVGGIKFKKVDAQSNKALEGAEFVVYDEEHKGYLKFEDSETRQALKFVSDQSQASKFTSKADGTFAIEYIPYNLSGKQYTLIETKAPEGYAVGKDFKFTVEKGTYTETLNNPTEVKNAKKGLLPSTGGYGIYIFLVLGLALMGGAYAWFRRTRKNENV